MFVATVAKFAGRQFRGNFVTSSRLPSVKKPNFLAQAKLDLISPFVQVRPGHRRASVFPSSFLRDP